MGIFDFFKREKVDEEQPILDPKVVDDALKIIAKKDAEVAAAMRQSKDKATKRANAFYTMRAREESEIQEMKESGEYDEIHAKLFGNRETSDETDMSDV